MRIGLPREIKPEEYRVGMTPMSAREYIDHGHTVLVERGAGLGSGFSDDEYAAAGCGLAERAAVFGQAEMLVKVKEPLPEEYGLLIADLGLETALARSRPIVEGLNTCQGRLTNLNVGKAHGLPAEKWR